MPHKNKCDTSSDDDSKCVRLENACAKGKNDVLVVGDKGKIITSRRLRLKKLHVSEDLSVDGSLNIDCLNVGKSIADLNASLSAEITRAECADVALGSRIDNEKVRARAAEGTLAKNISDERVRALAAEGVLTNTLNAEVTARGTAITSAVAAETSRALVAENRLNTRIDNLPAGAKGDKGDTYKDQINTVSEILRTLIGAVNDSSIVNPRDVLDTIKTRSAPTPIL